MTGGIVLGIRLRFHHHTPQQGAVVLAFHQPATDELGGDQLGRAAEDGLGQGWETLGSELGGYGCGLGSSKGYITVRIKTQE